MKSKIGRFIYEFNTWLDKHTSGYIYLILVITFSFILSLIIVNNLFITFSIIALLSIIFVIIRLEYITGDYKYKYKYKLTPEELSIKRGRELREKKIKKILRKF